MTHQKGEDKSTVEYWKYSGLIDGLSDGAQKVVVELFFLAAQVIDKNGWVRHNGDKSGAEKYLMVVIRRAWSDITNICQTHEEMELHADALRELKRSIEAIGTELNDFNLYIPMGTKFFKTSDWEAEVISMFAKEWAYRIFEFCKAVRATGQMN
jgi:hypothetical protein